MSDVGVGMEFALSLVATSTSTAEGFRITLPDKNDSELCRFSGGDSIEVALKDGPRGVVQDTGVVGSKVSLSTCNRLVRDALTDAEEFL